MTEEDIDELLNGIRGILEDPRLKSFSINYRSEDCRDGAEVTPEGTTITIPDLLKESRPSYDTIYSRDNKETVSGGWVQYKGTDLCVDLHCECGHHGHYDGLFAYAMKCSKCTTPYAVGQNIKLIPLGHKEEEYFTDYKGF